MSDNDKVICPNCVHEFAAIPVNIQSELSRLTTKLAASKKDAERFAWWFDKNNIYAAHTILVKLVKSDGAIDMETLRAAIDAATGSKP